MASRLRNVGLIQQRDGVYGKQMDACIDIQGRGAPATEQGDLLQQVALRSPGAASYKTWKNIWCVSVGACEEITQNTQAHTAVFSGSDFHSSRATVELLPSSLRGSLIQF